MEKVKSVTCQDIEYQFLATSAPGLADLLAQELSQLSLKVTPVGRAAVSFEGTMRQGLEVCLQSRLAERVLCRLVKVGVSPREAAHALATAFDWETHLAAADAVHVEVELGGKPGVSGLAVARDFIAAAPQRLVLSASAKQALSLHLFVTEQTAELAIDLSGEPLQRRGYRLGGGKAPLRETLAASLLAVAGWRGGKSLIDPFCGSGTILIEAALLAKQVAPGLQRDFFGFMQWGQCPKDIWPALCEEARQRVIPLPAGIKLKGFDADADCLRLAQANAERAGVAADIHFERRELGALRERDLGSDTMLISNPPWGDRLETVERAAWLHAALGQKLADLSPGCMATLLGARVDVLDRCGMELQEQVTLLNGAEKNWIRRYLPRRRVPALPLMPGAGAFELKEAAQPLANRLQKNARQLSHWLESADTDVYRLYDRDLPEFNFTLDVYGSQVLMQEWKAPRQIDEAKVKERRQLALSAVRSALACHREQVFLRTRERQKGSNQYQKLAGKQRFHIVREGQARLLVNLQDYHDTGLFLDHRRLRLRLAEEAVGKRFLNLFAYTGSATVQAAVGGARASISVDSSRRYMDWAASNLALNGFSTLTHQLITEDVRLWLAGNHDTYDTIFCDPPTFSNSKSRDDFVVQRDHASLIHSLMKRLAPEGTLYFSCNFRDFKLDDTVAQAFKVTDIGRQTMDPDAALHQSRHGDVHHCFQIQHLETNER
jgi:23S rRNA (guanine2445-N2)-methyltransferase / 23S rRNA (guanine2069-N7)-methyltransferase